MEEEKNGEKNTSYQSYLIQGNYLSKLEVSTKNTKHICVFYLKFGGKQKAFQKLLGHFKRRKLYQKQTKS